MTGPAGPGWGVGMAAGGNLRWYIILVPLVSLFLLYVLLQTGCRVRPTPTPAATLPTTPPVSTPASSPTPTPTLTLIPRPDNAAPYLDWSAPVAGSRDAGPDGPISLVIRDDSAGIDVSSITMTVGGNKVLPKVSGSPESLALKYQPPSAFAYRQSVEVVVEVRDRAPQPNSARIALAFTVMERPRELPPLFTQTGNIRLNMVYYGRHTPEVDAHIINLNPQYIIGNPAHGLWGEVYGPETGWLLQNVARFQASGIKVIGYITAGYEGRGSGSGIEFKWSTLDMNKMLIKDMATIDRVDGVFIDECSAFPGNEGKKYLKELADYAHSFNLFVWGNVGSADFSDWYFTEGGFDMMNANENWRGQPLSRVQAEWGDRISVTSHDNAYDARLAYELTLDAWSKGLAYSYLSPRYSVIPDWMNDFMDLLRRSS